MVLHECPFCHRPFEAQLLSREQVDSSELTKASEFPLELGSQGGLLFNPLFGPTDEERSAIALRPEAFLTFKETYRCKHCGKEWTKITVEEKPLPLEYVEDEEEKTDYDADVEEEAAREEEYAREK